MRFLTYNPEQGYLLPPSVHEDMRARGQVPQPHVLGHSLTKRCHR